MLSGSVRKRWAGSNPVASTYYRTGYIRQTAAGYVAGIRAFASFEQAEFRGRICICVIPGLQVGTHSREQGRAEA